MTESEFIDGLRAFATHPAARGLRDDAAVLDVSGTGIVLTHDMLVEGVHYLPEDPAETVAWKLVAVNMSDLAAKGAEPLGVILGFTLTQNSAWERAFTAGLNKALAAFGAPLLGGDTVAMPAGTSRSLGLTAIGKAPAAGAPSRMGARAGDFVFVSGTIGDAGAGLALLQGTLETADSAAHDALTRAYRRPEPSLALGQALAPYVHAMADISDGLLIDAQRMAGASQCSISLNAEQIPLSAAYMQLCGDTLESRMSAAVAGDDYRLLFTAPPRNAATIRAAAAQAGAPIFMVGECAAGTGLSLRHKGQPVPLPASLGYEHAPRPPR